MKLSAALLNQDLGWYFKEARRLDQSASTTACSQLVELNANLTMLRINKTWRVNL
jgi:hypothetical protein